MLILSRRPKQRIIFPALGIKVSVERVAGKVVRLGIDAPEEIRILREEVTDDRPDADGNTLGTRDPTRHALLNRLNTASLGLQLLQHRMEAGQTEDLESLIVTTLDELHKLNVELDRHKKNGDATHHDSRLPRALVVEDNANEAQLLAEYLRVSGYAVNVVPNGLRAVEHLRVNGLPDVVLLDMNMPEMNGPETIASIRAEPSLRGVKLFGVSGADQQELGIETGASGVDGWFTKPVNARTLVDKMNRELEDRDELVPYD